MIDYEIQAIIKRDGLAPKENMMQCVPDQKGKVNISYNLMGDKLSIVLPILDVVQAYDINSYFSND